MKSKTVYGALNTREEKCEPYCLLVGYGSVFQHSLTLPPQLPISRNSGKEKTCLAFLEPAQVKQIMDLSLFYYLCNAKTEVSSSPAPGTERALFYFLWAKQLWWILNPLMAWKAKTNVQAWLQLELLDVLAPFSSFPPEEAKHAEHQRCHLGLVSSAIWEFLPCWGTSGAANF